MFFITFLASMAALLALATASPVHPCRPHHPSSTTTTTASTLPTVPAKPYTVIAAHSASAIHLQAVNAAGEAFWIGGQPSTYCPSIVGTSCPPGNLTAFMGLTSMDTLVPGGQVVYVCPSLALGFSQAHSALIPPGCSTNGFTFIGPGANGLGHWGYQGFGADGFMACPTSSGRYQVFAAGQNATAPLGDVSKCIGFDALTSYYNGPPPAWQYA